jgi:flagellar M-ring protein FliF
MRILVVTTAAAMILLIAYFAWSATNEPYVALYTNLDRDEASSLVAKLKELKVSYRLAGAGNTIEVPESKVAEARLDLAAAGLPRGGGVGFESFDKMRLGATEFEQRVLYRRALEGELARSISTIGAVASTRVHLVLPEKSVFVSHAEPASASIVLQLRVGKELAPSEVSAIIHLASAAVPGLTSDRVALVTTEGQMLHRPREGNGESANGMASSGDDSMTPAQATEKQLEDRVRSMLEKTLGPGHVDVRVTADVDLSRIEHVEDHYDPARTSLRSESKSVERTNGVTEDTAAGVPGAESNLPTEKPGADSANAKPNVAPVAAVITTPSAAASGSTAPAVPAQQIVRVPLPIRESFTRNFEVDHVSEKRVTTTGVLKRIAVAVLVDGETKVENGKSTFTTRSKEQMDQLHAIVRSAVGADAVRGDVVSVECVPFLGVVDHKMLEGSLATTAEDTSVLRFVPAKYRNLVTYGAIGLGALLLILLPLFMLRGARKAVNEAEFVTDASGKQIESGEFTRAALNAPVSEADLREEAFARAKRDPATAALVLRYWLGTSASAASLEGSRDKVVAA